MAVRVYLIPGFFGFANIGDLKYFAHVRDLLHQAFARRGVRADIHYVPVPPTSSLRERTLRLVEEIAATSDSDDDEIHLVGHSTGGLDARLLASAALSLRASIDAKRYAARIRTVVCIATPHYGTPLAGFFTSILGQRLLRDLSAVTLHSFRYGSIPLPALVALAGAVPGTGLLPLRGPTLSVLDQVYKLVLKDFDAQRRREIAEFIEAAAKDQALLAQLAPECMEMLDMLGEVRPGVRCASVVTRARPPRLRGMWTIGLSPLGQGMYALFQALYRLAAGFSGDRLPPLTPSQAAVLMSSYGDLPQLSDNDTIVPSLSQVWGQVIHATWADHHDVIGHFAGPECDPPHVDWLGTLSGFSREHFTALWGDVVQFMARAP